MTESLKQLWWAWSGAAVFFCACLWAMARVLLIATFNPFDFGEALRRDVQRRRLERRVRG